MGGCVRDPGVLTSIFFAMYSRTNFSRLIGVRFARNDCETQRSVGFRTGLSRSGSPAKSNLGPLPGERLRQKRQASFERRLSRSGWYLKPWLLGGKTGNFRGGSIPVDLRYCSPC